MNRITLVTGGARSGKSTFAEQLLKEEERVLYIATAIAFDEEMKERIKKHQKSRPRCWDTFEGYKNLKEVIEQKAKAYNFVLLDCVTLWISNLLFDFFSFEEWERFDEGEFDKAEKIICQEVQAVIDMLKTTNTNIVFVTNELGFSLTPENKMGRVFRDIQGRINQLIAKNADDVFLLVCGQPLKIK